MKESLDTGKGLLELHTGVTSEVILGELEESMIKCELWDHEKTLLDGKLLQLFSL